MSLNGGNNNFDMNRQYPPLSKLEKFLGRCIVLGIIGFLGLIGYFI